MHSVSDLAPNNHRRYGVRLLLPAQLGLCFLLAAASAGCGDGIVRREISGAVNFNKKPLARGLIEFDPLDGQSTRMDALVEDGQFHLAKRDGLADGKYRVRISATGKTDHIPVPEGHVGPPPIPADWLPVNIPDRYSRTSKLMAEVRPSENQFTFDLVFDPKIDGKEDKSELRHKGQFEPPGNARPAQKE
jgi:hypothetical protein